MKKLIVFISVILLTGCPCKGYEGKQYGLWRPIHIDGNRVCFTIDKNDVLESYRLASNNDAFNKLLHNYSTRLSYPDTCFTVNFEKAVIYGGRYKINKQWYNYSFIIDNDGKTIDLGSGAACPYPSVVSL